MFSFLYPDLYEASIYSISYKSLLSKNINTLFFDIDNTLLPHFIPLPDEKLVNFLDALNGMGFKICILSNASKKRVEHFMAGLPYNYVYRACKPLFFGINKALRALGSRPENSAVVGDQIFTDILVGKRKKVYTVLVKPISEKDEWTVKLKRGAEKVIINEYKKRRHNSY